MTQAASSAVECVVGSSCLTAEQHDQLVSQYSANNYAPLPVVIRQGQGAWVEDVEGKRYLDMLSAYSALNFGHSHPEILEVFLEQSKRLTLTSRAFQNDQFGPFCQEITAFCGQDMVLPMNTGAEAVETAIKTARKWGYQVKGVEADKAEIIVVDGNFHGRTVTIVSFSRDPQFKDGFGPLTPGFKMIPYGDADALAVAISPNTVGFLVEPLQGEGGVVVPPDGYLKACLDICHENNVLFIADEIQTGLGRTGKMFACEHENVKPDVLILGKALGGGVMPVSAVLSTKEVLGVFNPGDHGSTFGGNPLACAVARIALHILQRDKLAERAHDLGQTFMERLRTIGGDKIKEIRGKGLLIGVEFHASAGVAKTYCKQLMNEGILCKDTVKQVMRFAPPLVVEQKDLDWAFERIKKVLS